MFMYDFQGGVSQRDDGTPVRMDQLGGYTVELDLSEQVLGLKILEELQLGGGGRRGVEPRVIPSLADLLPAYTSFGQRLFVSASMLAQKAKQFDDGLYAAVALAAQEGTDDFAGKKDLLKQLTAELTGNPAGQPGEVVLAAAELGGLAPELAPSITPAIDRRIKTFLDDERTSKPIAFYTWSAELEAVFRQDRMLQSKLEGSEDIVRLAQIIQANATVRDTYQRYLRLMSRLTNPFPENQPSLSDILEKPDQALPDSRDSGVRFFPPSRSHETDLGRRLYENKSIPKGFNLIEELIRCIRTHDIDLTPAGESGWYDHQLWALEPLVMPDGLPESSHLQLGKRYRRQLEELFKGLLTLTRETHVEQLVSPTCGARMPFISISPWLSLEPTATYYLRRSRTYGFVRTILEEAFGESGLRGMHRLTTDGPVEVDMDTELSSMEQLFLGAYITVMRELGIDPGTNDKQTVAAATYADWAKGCGEDPDLGQDARAMVPIFYDIERCKTKVWLFLGWSTQHLDIAFSRPPRVTIVDETGTSLPPESMDIKFEPVFKFLIHPVTAETYVDNILDRKEFQRHCDEFKTMRRIVDALH
jgi:hypothetical protein